MNGYSSCKWWKTKNNYWLKAPLNHFSCQKTIIELIQLLTSIIENCFISQLLNPDRLQRWFQRYCSRPIKFFTKNFPGFSDCFVLRLPTLTTTSPHKHCCYLALLSLKFIFLQPILCSYPIFIISNKTCEQSPFCLIHKQIQKSIY